MRIGWGTQAFLICLQLLAPSVCLVVRVFWQLFGGAVCLREVASLVATGRVDKLCVVLILGLLDTDGMVSAGRPWLCRSGCGWSGLSG